MSVVFAEAPHEEGARRGVDLRLTSLSVVFFLLSGPCYVCVRVCVCVRFALHMCGCVGVLYVFVCLCGCVECEYLCVILCWLVRNTVSFCNCALAWCARVCVLFWFVPLCTCLVCVCCACCVWHRFYAFGREGSPFNQRRSNIMKQVYNIHIRPASLRPRRSE